MEFNGKLETTSVISLASLRYHRMYCCDCEVCISSVSWNEPRLTCWIMSILVALALLKVLCPIWRLSLGHGWVYIRSPVQFHSDSDILIVHYNSTLSYLSVVECGLFELQWFSEAIFAWIVELLWVFHVFVLRRRKYVCILIYIRFLLNSALCS